MAPSFPDPRPELMLLDAASLYFRSFHGVPDSFTAPDGTVVNALRGFLDSVAYLITLRGPGRVVACWDEDWRPAFRVEAIPSYKAHRVANPRTNAEEVPDLLTPQVPLIIEALSLLGVCRAGAAGYEADDVIGTLTARQLAAGRGQVDVVTGDRDLFQLADDSAAVRVLYVGRGVRKLEIVDEAWLLGKYGVTSGQMYAEMATLRGDPSDGLPGVAGIGEKTAAGMLNRFGTLTALREAAADPSSDLSPGQRKKLAEASDYLDAAPRVVTVAPDAPVPDLDDALPGTPPDHAALVAFAEKWGVESSVARMVQAMTKAAG
ncbi:5'-3' exonuclease [Kineosporia succinea]|uniref:5'-3' exonuclease n=1 Tax=Kineosporia succinea TaxID=84632 RepID=A0ABT9P9B5_9ACTN|nr:5'-3' exonuclease [Kineosporia succinea]MDP9828750.1 5'-3' exonuclease [Kineosporia succinea]